MLEYPRLVLEKSLSNGIFSTKYRIVEKSKGYCRIEKANGTDSMGQVIWILPDTLDNNTASILIQYLLSEFGK